MKNIHATRPQSGNHRPDEKGHECDVALNANHTAWLITCPTCGRVGQPHKYQGDAYAIADRHAEVGGFERAV